MYWVVDFECIYKILRLVMFKRDSDICLIEFKYWIKVGMKDSKVGFKIFYKKNII